VPALVGPFLALALGAALAFLGRADAPREDESAARARLAVAALFGALVFAPACAYFLVFAGDWALFYLADSRGVPSALELLLVVTDAALVAAGFAAGHLAAKRRAEVALFAMMVAPGTIAGALVLAFVPRLRLEGTFHQITARFGTQPLAGSTTGWAVLWMNAMIVAGFVVAARALAERPYLSRPVPPAPQGPSPRPAEPARLLGRRR
jgi:uncharacterized membrane protein (DUF485 family)